MDGSHSLLIRSQQFGTQMPQGGHPPHHSITSSARASSVVGTVRPSAFAVLSLPVQLDEIGSISDQTAAGGEEARGVDRGKSVPGRRRDDQIAMNRRQRAPRHDQTTIRRARKSRDGALDLSGVAHVDRPYIHPDRRRHGLDYRELADPAGYGGITENCCPRYAWRDLLEQLQPFCAQAVFEGRETGGVAARLG